MTARLILLALACLAGCQCQRPQLVSSDGELRADALRVDFGSAWLHSTARRSVAFSNTGRSPLTLELQTEAPFAAPAQLELGGGESQQVELTFVPTALGASTGLINVRAGNRHLTLALDGAGVDPPPCNSGLCRSATLDPLTLSCVQSPLPDGEACTDRCVTGTCSGGACVGTAAPCDDADPCTVDACAPGEGCVHLPKQCASTDPCLVGSCSPATGCVQTPAADGVACGDADCTTANICVAGQCVTRTVPDGTACGPESICQQRGVCTAQACVQPPASTLVRAWNYASPRRLHGLVADPQGNFFTAECRSVGPFNAGVFEAQCELISFSPTGAERWRTPYPHISDTGKGSLRDALMIANKLVISTIGPSWVDAFDATTGAHQWSLDTSTSGIFGAVNPSWVKINSAAFNGTDELILTLESHVGGGIASTRVVGLVSTTGAVRHSLLLPAQGFSVVIDRASNLYLGHLSGLPNVEDTVTALDPSWNVRWQRKSPVIDNRISTLRATHNGMLLLTHPTIALRLGTAPGGPVAALGFNSATPDDPGVAWGDNALFLTDMRCPSSAPCQSFNDRELSVLMRDEHSGMTSRGFFSKVSWYSGLSLTNRGSVLISLSPRGGATADLRELSPYPDYFKMQCSLGLEQLRRMQTGALLTVGQYAMLTGLDSDGHQPELNVWLLPGYAPASSGWLSPRGGTGNDSRAR